jgi:hypothetical protein
MARDLKALKQDWDTHPCLRYIACKNVQELSEYLEKIHKSLIGDEGLASAYLYQKQIERNIQLRKELEECRKQMQSK